VHGFVDRPKITDRVGGRVSIDWRFAPRDVLSLGYSVNYYYAPMSALRFNAAVGTKPVALERQVDTSAQLWREVLR
jgi:hypothetical protein